MKLPFRQFTYIPSGKLLGYLLSENHAVGKAKAKFFRLVGFDVHDADMLEQGLIAIAQEQPVVEVVTSPYGTKYIIDGPLTAPNGRTIHIRTVWIIENNVSEPRFVTAYPRNRVKQGENK